MPFIGVNSEGILNRSYDGLNHTIKETVQYLTDCTGEMLIIDAGSTSDGASTPCFIWSIVPPFGKHWLAAVLHDYLYRFTKRKKEFCDQVFHEAMLSCGVSKVEAWTMYEAVSHFGHGAFSEDRKVIK